MQGFQGFGLHGAALTASSAVLGRTDGAASCPKGSRPKPESRAMSRFAMLGGPCEMPKRGPCGQQVVRSAKNQHGHCSASRVIPGPALDGTAHGNFGVGASAEARNVSTALSLCISLSLSLSHHSRSFAHALSLSLSPSFSLSPSLPLSLSPSLPLSLSPSLPLSLSPSLSLIHSLTHSLTVFSD